MMERFKRPLAILCLIAIGILLIGAVVLAIFWTDETSGLLMADLFCLIVIPCIFYAYQMMLNLIKRKNKDKKN